MGNGYYKRGINIQENMIMNTQTIMARKNSKDDAFLVQLLVPSEIVKEEDLKNYIDMWVNDHMANGTIWTWYE